MGDPDLYRGEQVLLRTPGVYVKSIPFEGVLTNMRIILVDRARNILPTKEVAYDMIQEAEIGANAIGDQVLTLTVQTSTGENRQMILTFSHREGGDRTRDRDEWVRIIQQGVSEARNAAARQQAAAPQRVTVKRAAQPDGYDRPAPVPREPDISPSPGILFCTKCGNQVLADSAFCNKCGSPIVAPAPSSRPAPPPVQEPAYETPAARVPVEPPRASQPTAPRPAVPLQATGKPAKKGFLSGLLGGGKKKQAAPRPAAPRPPAKSRRSPGAGKKILMTGLIIVVILVVLAAGALVVYPMISSSLGSAEESPSGSSPEGESPSASSTTTPSAVTTGALSNSGVASITVRETTAPTVPVTGVWVVIDYIGGFTGTYGMSSDLQKVDSSGSRIYEVVNATGTIQANIAKKDSSTKHALSVSIYQNGQLLKSGTTSDSYGKVSVSAATKT